MVLRDFLKFPGSLFISILNLRSGSSVKGLNHYPNIGA